MTDSKPSKSQANFQFFIWNKQAEAASSEDLYVRIQKFQLPEEVVSLLHDLLSKTKQIAGKIIHIGKIILIKILEFLEDHLFLVVGGGIGFVLGAALASLITTIPFIGALLAPVAAAVGLTVTVAGAITGHGLDKIIPGVGKSMAEIAKDFFKLFITIANVIFDDSSNGFSIA